MENNIFLTSCSVIFKRLAYNAIADVNYTKFFAKPE